MIYRDCPAVMYCRGMVWCIHLLSKNKLWIELFE